MSYNIQYGHVDRSTLSRMIDELEEKIDGQPTPDPEPTGKTTDYQGICQNDLGGTWDATAMTCSFTYTNPDTGDLFEKVYSTENLEAYTACTNGTWDYMDDSCCDAACECAKIGGEYNPETGECVTPEPNPCEGYSSQEECDCVQRGGAWDPESQTCIITPDPE